jgi:hypothetical protein
MHKPLITLLLALTSLTIHADPIPVRRPQGTLHGFLVLRSEEGKILANGDLTQTLRNGIVTTRVTFRFRDGSLDDETTVFSQATNFKLITDHHIQKGPSFHDPLDITVEAATGQVTSRTTDKDGKEKVTEDHLDLAPDLTSNNLLLIQLMNLPADATSTTLPMIAPAAKPRLIKATITSVGETPVTTGTLRRKATEYLIKIDIGGVAKVIAPIVGKAPADTHIWMIPGDAPSFVRQEGQFFSGGPIWSVEQTAPTLPRTTKK